MGCCNSKPTEAGDDDIPLRKYDALEAHTRPLLRCVCRSSRTSASGETDETEASEQEYKHNGGLVGRRHSAKSTVWGDDCVLSLAWGSEVKARCWCHLCVVRCGSVLLRRYGVSKSAFQCGEGHSIAAGPGCTFQ